MSELANSIRRATARLNRANLARKFDPNQPRVPAGNADGGQWSDGGGSSGGTSNPLARNRATPRTSEPSRSSSWALSAREKVEGGERTIHAGPGGALIASERRTGVFTGARTSSHRVLLPDGSGIRIENDRFGVQRIFDRQGNLVSATRWGRNGPQDVAVAQQAYFDEDPDQPGSGQITLLPTVSALALFNLYLSRRTAGELPVFGFRAAKFEGRKDVLAPTFVGAVAEEDVDFACPRHHEVRKLTTAFANELRPLGMNPQEFGTAVHTRLKYQIDRRNDPNFKAERSFWKAEYELGKNARLRYGQSGTLRIDVLEEVADGTVCVYDIKTGRSGFSLARMKEIAAAVHRNFNNVRSYIVIEVRPD